MTVADALDADPCEHGGGSSGEGVDPGQTCGVIGLQRRSGVESEPAEPQAAGAEHDEGGVVRAHRPGTKSDAWAEDEGQGKGGSAGVDVDRGATGKVDGVHGVEDPAGAEHPVGGREVDQQAPQDGEYDPGGELHTVSDGAADEGSCDDGEGGLEGDEDESGNGSDLGSHDPVEFEVLGGVADEASPLRVTEGHRVTADHPEDADGPHRNDVHHEHVEHALGPHHTAVEEGEHRCHEQHQGRAGEYPRGVAGIDLKQWCHGVNRHLAALRNRLVGVTDM